jgi:hypothetical protein
LLLSVEPPSFGGEREVWNEWYNQKSDGDGHGALDDEQPLLERLGEIQTQVGV